MGEPPAPKRFADGSGNGTALETATVRALDAYMMIGRHADRLSEELDQVTQPGVVGAPLSDEDSLVIAIREIAHKRDA
jgi:hypothetical protein